MEILGIDIGGSGIKGALVNTDTGTLTTDRFRVDTPPEATPQAVALVTKQIARHFDWQGILGCTIPARVEHGVVHTAANIHNDWIETRVDDLVSSATGCPTHCLNDADAAGVASIAFGAGRSRMGVVFFVTVGTGIGSALFTDQHLVPNTELGHLPLHGDAAENWASNRIRKEENLSWEEWAGRFQEYLDLVEFLFAPDTIIVGGGVSRPEKVALYRHCLQTQAELVIAELENEAGIIGAALSARQQLVS
ncbi:MAG: polyphosphate glucokinase [Bacteroidetes bacterium CG12_big_fil_rev_8_21_14_0_65_60_17]|nr:MAG: polyphosphate glucokinase [Bacteroidetes bacterium CG12_big_fil_rev_8_21_14_0_65_60_17]